MWVIVKGSTLKVVSCLSSSNNIIFVRWLKVCFLRGNYPLESWIWHSFFINVTLFFFSLSFYLEEFKSEWSTAARTVWQVENLERLLFRCRLYTNVIFIPSYPPTLGEHLSLSPTHTDVDVIYITSEMYVQVLNLCSVRRIIFCTHNLFSSFDSLLFILFWELVGVFSLFWVLSD